MLLNGYNRWPKPDTHRRKKIEIKDNNKMSKESSDSNKKGWTIKHWKWMIMENKADIKTLISDQIVTQQQQQVPEVVTRNY